MINDETNANYQSLKKDLELKECVDLIKLRLDFFGSFFGNGKKNE